MHSKGRMVAEGFCARVPEKSDGAPSHEQLLADNAAVIKRELTIAAEHRIGELRDKVLALSSDAEAAPVASVP